MFFTNLSLGSELPSYSCSFWEPDEQVQTFQVDSNQPSLDVYLSNRENHLWILNHPYNGLSLSLWETVSKEMIVVSRGKQAAEVSLSFSNPRFSVSCFPSSLDH